MTGLGIVVGAGLLASAAAQPNEKSVDEQWLSKPPQVFAVPTARPIPAYDLGLSSYSTFATDSHQIRTTGIFGLAGLAQIEATNIRVVADLAREARTIENIPAAGVKVFIPISRLTRILPDVAASAWRTFPATERRETSYRQETGDVYLVGSWNLFGSPGKTSGWRGIDIHAGANLSGARIRRASDPTMDAGEGEADQSMEPTDTTDGDHAAMPAPEALASGATTVSNEWMPFGGVELWLTRRVALLGELKWTPSVVKADGMVESVWSARSGVRVFFAPYLSADVGVQYQEDFDTVADTNLEARISLLVPVHQLLRRR